MVAATGAPIAINVSFELAGIVVLLLVVVPILIWIVRAATGKLGQ